jgi:hypothetical protein
MTEDAERAREYRCRRAAARLGLHLSKDRTTGLWFVAKVLDSGRSWRSRLLQTSEFGISLEAAEQYIVEAAAEEAAAVEAARQQHRQEATR